MNTRPAHRRQPFVSIETALLDRNGAELGPNAIAVYVAVARLSQADTPPPLRDAVAGLTGMTSTAVSEAMERLIRGGFVSETIEPDPVTGLLVQCWTLVDLSPSVGT